MKHLFFCRHGESELNARGIYSGHIDTPLTATGREQAKLAGSQAKNLRFDLIVSSPLIRALETARIIAQEVNYPLDKIVVSKLLIERSLGSLEGQPFTVGPENSSQDVETEAALTNRAKAALDYLQTLGAENILVVGHGSFSRALRGLLQPDTPFGEQLNAEIIKLI